jgi:uroporphyrinogen decarboxylase
MISGRENYARAIEFRGPEYLPCTLDVNLGWLQETDELKAGRIRELQARFPADLLGALNVARNAQEPVTRDGVRRWVDEWGTGWADPGTGAKTESYPLAEGYDLLSGHTFPDPCLPGRFAQADALLQQRRDQYVRSRVWFTLFERLWMLRGFENMLLDPHDQPKEWAALRDRVVEFNLAVIDQWIERGVDAVYFSDDWGTQRGLLISPTDWRRFYKPAYQVMFARVRAGGAHVWMHLCGNVTAILPDLIEIGLNVLNPVQPQAMDVRALARDFGGRVCFNGGVDIQGTMIHGQPEDVKREVRELVALFGRFGGGYIGGTSHTIMPETPLDNVIAMYEAFLESQ